MPLLSPRFRFLLLAFWLLPVQPGVQSAWGADTPSTDVGRRDASIGWIDPAAERYRALHASYLARAQEGPIGVLFLGDSITRGWIGEGRTVWDQYYAPLDAANFGIGGDRTMGLIWRIENGALENMNPQVVVLLLGTNNTDHYSGAEIAAANAKIVGLIRERLPRARVVLLAIFPRGPRVNNGGSVDDHLRRMAAIHEANRRMAALDDGEHVRFLDVSAAFLDADGTIPATVMPDQLHLSADGYRRWAEAMAPLMGELWAGSVRSGPGEAPLDRKALNRSNGADVAFEAR